MSMPLMKIDDPGQRVDIVHAHTAAELPPLDFVLPGLLAGSVGMIAAPGATGKGYVMLQAAFTVAAETDIPLFDGAWPAPARRGEVCILMAEDPAQILEQRSRAVTRHLVSSVPGVTDDVIGDIAKRIEIRSLVGVVPHILGPRGECSDEHKRWRDYLLQCATGRRLLILDTAARFHSADENSNGEMTLLVQTIEAIAKKTGCTVLISHHASKAAALGGQGMTQQAARGASALVDSCRWVMTMARMTEREAIEHGVDDAMRGYYLRASVSKNNYGSPIDDLWLRRGDGGVLSRALLTPAAPKRRGRRDDNGELVEIPSGSETWSLSDLIDRADLPPAPRRTKMEQRYDEADF